MLLSRFQYLCSASVLGILVLLLIDVKGYQNTSIEMNPYSADICNEANCQSTALHSRLITALNNMESNLTNIVYLTTILDMNLCKPANVLVEDLWSTYQKGDHESFRTMIRSQLSLFWIQQAQNVDRNYLLKAAYCFRKIQSDPLYTCLSKQEKYKLEQAIKSLPSSLEYVFFKNKFCLLNKMYSEVLYQAAVYLDSTTLYVFTWSGEKNVAQENGWIRPIYVDLPNDRITNVQLAMYGEYHHSITYRNSNYDNVIVGNRTQQILNNNIWTMYLEDDDHIVLKQDGYALCATKNFNSKRRYVYGLLNTSAEDKNCMWSPGECDRRI